ncbi:MAG: hypothetical protein GY856_29530, partial [bacterium]|nr:hypothetical protein [bacterium]
DAGALRAELLLRRNPDGGWSLGPELESTPLDSALAVLALTGHGDVPAPVLDAAGWYLAATQSPGGGWSYHPGGASRTAATAAVMQALKALGREAEVDAETLAWLGSRQNPDGGFGDSPTTAHDTANVLAALMRLGALGEIDGVAAATFLKNSQDEAGSWEGSTYTTALAVNALRRFDFPNWTFTGPIAAAPQEPRDGERVDLGLEVINNGNAAAPAGLLRLFAGDPEAGGTVIHEITIPELAPGGRATISSWWDTFDQPGPQTLVAVLDPDAAVAELSEKDNRATLAIEVTPAPDGVDLALSHSDLAVFPAQPDSLPVTLTLSATVRNVGKTDAGSVRVRLWRSAPEAVPETGELVGEVVLIVPQRSSAAANFTCELTTSEATLLTVDVDPDDEIAEADEGNNRAQQLVLTVPSVDYAVGAGDIALEGVTFPGRDLTFRVTLRNRGTRDGAQTEVRYLLDDGVSTEQLFTSSVQLAAGDSVEHAVVWRADRLGDLRFVVQLDPQNTVLESDETNNGADLEFIVTEAGQADLTVSHQDLAADPDPGLEGAPATITALVRNTGGQALTDVEVALFDGDPAAGGSRIGDPTTISALAPGESLPAALILPVLTGAGDRLLYVVVDPNDQIAELDEDDNLAFLVLEVLSLPDLAVSASSLSVEPAYPAPGETVTVTAGVANLGEQDAAGVVVRLTSAGLGLAPDQTLDLVPGAGAAEAVFTWTCPEDDAVALEVTVDPGDAVAEGSEANNTVTRLVSTGSGGPVSNRYFSPDGDGVKDTTVFTFALASPATVTIEIRDPRGELVRWYRGGEHAGVAAGTFAWDGLDDAGRVVADGDYEIAALGTGGARF